MYYDLKTEGTLPISVIVPLSKKRKYFFDNYTLPLIEANNLAEIIVIDDNDTAPRKRNKGFDKSTQPYLFFCDDDILLPKSHLEKLYNVLLSSKDDIGFTYSGYNGIVLDSLNHPMKGNFKIPTIEYDENKLKSYNFISTMSLIKRKCFIKFDESLKRLQDWDLWLTLLENNYKGIAIKDNEFFAFYLDSGITSNHNSENDAVNVIKNKHKLF